MVGDLGNKKVYLLTLFCISKNNKLFLFVMLKTSQYFHLRLNYLLGTAHDR